jgi:hypothetical protein
LTVRRGGEKESESGKQSGKQSGKESGKESEVLKDYCSLSTVLTS